MTEFNCTDCGIHVYMLTEVTTYPVCATCHFLRENVPDEKERERLRNLLSSKIKTRTDSKIKSEEN